MWPRDSWTDCTYLQYLRTAIYIIILQNKRTCNNSKFKLLYICCNVIANNSSQLYCQFYINVTVMLRTPNTLFATLMQDTYICCSIKLRTLNTLFATLMQETYICCSIKLWTLNTLSATLMHDTYVCCSIKLRTLTKQFATFVQDTYICRSIKLRTITMQFATFVRYKFYNNVTVLLRTLNT